MGFQEPVESIVVDWISSNGTNLELINFLQILSKCSQVSYAINIYVCFVDMMNLFILDINMRNRYICYIDTLQPFCLKSHQLTRPFPLE